jgi:hypothetical protein
MPREFLEFEAPRISREFALEGVKIVSRRRRLPLLPMEDPCYVFLSEAEVTVGS